MTPIDFNTLRDLLHGIEVKLAAPALPFSPGSRAIRAASVGSQVQIFGLGREEVAATLPVVVAIGGNYTQGTQPVPRDMAGSHMVCDKLHSWRQRVKKGFAQYVADPKWWTDCCAASNAKISPPAEFHFVMTNFCLWITKNSWQNTGAATRAALLECNPPLGNESTQPGCWAHLRQLRDVLIGFEVLWVGHGIHCEVFALFRQFMRELPNQRWLLLPNLAYHYNYADWHFLKSNGL